MLIKTIATFIDQTEVANHIEAFITSTLGRELGHVQHIVSADVSNPHSERTNAIYLQMGFQRDSNPISWIFTDENMNASPNNEDGEYAPRSVSHIEDLTETFPWLDATKTAQILEDATDPDGLANREEERFIAHIKTVIRNVDREIDDWEARNYAAMVARLNTRLQDGLQAYAEGLAANWDYDPEAFDYIDDAKESWLADRDVRLDVEEGGADEQCWIDESDGTINVWGVATDRFSLRDDGESHQEYTASSPLPKVT